MCGDQELRRGDWGKSWRPALLGRGGLCPADSGSNVLEILVTTTQARVDIDYPCNGLESRILV